VSTNPADEAGKRLLASLDMWEFGVELTQLRFRREHPEASDCEIRAMVRAWLRGRPADGAGRVVSWPRS
jgi:hypothetical protein